MLQVCMPDVFALRLYPLSPHAQQSSTVYCRALIAAGGGDRCREEGGRSKWRPETRHRPREGRRVPQPASRTMSSRKPPRRPLDSPSADLDPVAVEERRGGEGLRRCWGKEKDLGGWAAQRKGAGRKELATGRKGSRLSCATAATLASRRREAERRPGVGADVDRGGVAAERNESELRTCRGAFRGPAVRQV
jgi:hypothetical protein